MDISLIITGAMTLLKPLLEKGSEKAAETIGEKLAEKTTEKTFWTKIKNIFSVDEQEKLNAIEKKPVATKQEVELIENKLTKEVESNPQFAADVKAAFNLSPTDYLVAEELLKSIKDGQEKLKKLFQDRRDDPSIETSGQYKIMIRRVRDRLEEDETEFLSLVKKKEVNQKIAKQR